GGVPASTGTWCSNRRPRTDSASCSVFAMAGGVPPSCCCAGGGEPGCDGGHSFSSAASEDEGPDAGFDRGCGDDGGGANDLGSCGPSGSVTFPVHAASSNPRPRRQPAVRTRAARGRRPGTLTV